MGLHVVKVVETFQMLFLLVLVLVVGHGSGQTMIQVLDFRVATLEMTITNSSSFSYQPPHLNLLAKLGPKTQAQICM